MGHGEPGTGTAAPGSARRFSGFADLYDAERPSPPRALGPLLARYCGVEHPRAVDLGSGTGLSSRWAAGWASEVVGIEPSDDMRRTAERTPRPGLRYQAGSSDRTGLDDGAADVVLAVQAMHWMEPGPTLAEVARILRPGGVVAVVDADWPPVSGRVEAEEAWATLHRRIRVLEARAAAGDVGAALRRPIAEDDPVLADDDLADPHRNRSMPDGVRSWAKADHLARLAASGLFPFTRELVFNEPVAGGAERFVAVMQSQGSYQALRRLGLTDQEIGVVDFERRVRDAFALTPAGGLSFSWRARLGIR